jgi:hypothetical protein
LKRRLQEIGLTDSKWIALEFSISLCFHAALIRACWINLKTLLDKAFRLFSPQKVPTIGVIGGKIQLLFPWKLGNWLPQNR